MAPADGLEELNHVIQAKLADYAANYVRYEAIGIEDADIVLVTAHPAELANG